MIMGGSAATDILLISALLVASVASGTQAAPKLAIGGEPVRVEYYMEALCPYCANFTLHGLAPLFANKLSNFVQLDVIPFGNGRTDPSTGAMQCQHGVVECQLNKLLSCAIALEPSQDDWFPFFSCVEEAALKGVKAADVATVAHTCAVHAGIVPSSLMACYEGELGDSLQRLAAQRTDSLKPAHQWVPWVVVNGVPLLEDDENIMRYICVAYRGRDRPKICLDMPHSPPSTPAAAPKLPAAKLKKQRYQRCKRAGEQKVQQMQQGGVATA